MAEKETAARPYAEAVFGLARERGELKQWSEMLAFASEIASDAAIIELAHDPRVSRTRLAELFLDIARGRLSAEAGNFIRVLIENRRLTLVPEVARQFERLRGEAEGRIDVTVTSAYPLTRSQMKTIEEALKRRFGHDVSVTALVDEALIGGIVVRAGDTVIDGSVKGRLQQLAAHLNY